MHLIPIEKGNLCLELLKIRHSSSPLSESASNKQPSNLTFVLLAVSEGGQSAIGEFISKLCQAGTIDQLGLGTVSPIPDADAEKIYNQERFQRECPIITCTNLFKMRALANLLDDILSPERDICQCFFDHTSSKLYCLNRGDLRSPSFQKGCSYEKFILPPSAGF